MKAKALLITSVALNLMLALLLAWTHSRQPAAESSAGTPSTASAPRSETASPAAGSRKSAGLLAVTNNLVRKITWEQVESADYRQYINNLRSIGCPDETIRDIILADVSKLYDEKKKQVRGGPKKFEYWKSGNPLAGMMGDPEVLQKMRALEEEKNGVLRELGIQPDAMSSLMAMAGGNPMDAMFDFLPETKRSEVMKVMTDFQSKMMEGMKDGVGDGSDVMKAQREMELAIKQVLTPEEYQDYQLRFSMTANMMRQQITGFEPSEEEFLKLFKLRGPFDQEHSILGAMDATEAEQKKRAEAESALKDEIKKVLGPERYAAYERSQDFQYQQLYRIVKKAELAPAVANEVYDLKKIAEDQANRVRMDQNLSEEKRQAALLAIRNETERTMQQTLGDHAWEQYNRPNNMWWLRNIAGATGDQIIAAPQVIESTVIQVGQ